MVLEPHQGSLVLASEMGVVVAGWHEMARWYL